MGASKQRRPLPALVMTLAVAAVLLGLMPACGRSTAAGPGRQRAASTPQPPRMPDPPQQLPVGDPVLSQAWSSYKQAFIQADGRVMDPMRDTDSTSESQSYALLRAVWMEDRPEFDTVLRWTWKNLAVSSNGLFGYLWGQDSNHQYHLLSQNAATDADQDIALALIFAADRWRDDSYRQQARQILKAIWTQEVTTVRGTLYLTAGNWAPQTIDPGPILNPSYFAPYAYRIFATVDPGHPWQKLVDSSYQALWACSSASLGAGHSVGLPPNWCALSLATGEVLPFKQTARADDFGYDAFRVYWRVALDAIWNDSSQAHAYLLGPGAGFLRSQWLNEGSFASGYSHAGARLGAPDLTVYGGLIGIFATTDPTQARKVARKLLGSFHQESGRAHFDQPNNYYEQNWAWFGAAMAENRLPDLAPDLRA